MKRDRSSVVLPAALGALGVVAAWAVLSDEGSRAIPELEPTASEPVAQIEPAAVAIDVTAQRVRVHGQALPRASRFELHDGRIAADDLDGHLVRPLRDALGEIELADPIAITAEASTPWPTLLDLLYTAGRAGARRYALVTADGTIPIEPPKFDPAGRVDGPIHVIELAWWGDALVGIRRPPTQLGAIEPELDTGCRVADRAPSSGGRAALRALRDGACASAPAGVRFVLSPSTSADYGEIVRVASTLQSGAACPIVFTLAAGGEDPRTPAPQCDAEAHAAALLGPSGRSAERRTQ